MARPDPSRESGLVAITPEVTANIRILQDAMSSVAHPEIDFDAMANDTFTRFAHNGIRLVTTQDSIEDEIGEFTD